MRTCCECIHLCNCSPFHSKNMPTFIVLVHCGLAANDDDLPSGTNASTRALIRERTAVFDMSSMCTAATIEQLSNVEFIYYYHSIQPFGGIVPATKILSVGSLRAEESCVNAKIVRSPHEDYRDSSANRFGNCFGLKNKSKSAS
jgi:hypothetical protein